MSGQQTKPDPPNQHSAAGCAGSAGVPAPAVQILNFLEHHRPALEQNEARHNLILGLLGRLTDTGHSEARLWTLGGPGECAMQTSPRNAIILGELDEAQCRALADETLGLDYPGVVGFDPAVHRFVERAVERGMRFAEPIPATDLRTA